ncbi:MAG: 50S ribosomal protein L19 [Candidatus Omnitrophota bacterium]
MNNKIRKIEESFTKKEMPKFGIGDTVRVLTRIPEGPDKVRLHPFEGVVIAKKGSSIRINFTVRKMSSGEGIERVFPLYSPSIERIELIRSAKVHRAKLYYLRGKVGKHATKIEEAKKEVVK